MKTAYLAGAFALLLAAGSARGDAFIRGNNIDDFGPFTYSNPTPPPDQPLIATHASPIPGNNVDDFGPLLPAGYVAGQEELGAAGSEPGMEAKAQEKAAIREYNQRRFLEEIWAPGP